MDGETVRVVIGDEYGPDVTVTAKVTESGVKFLSCRLADSSEGADPEIYGWMKQALPVGSVRAEKRTVSGSFRYQMTCS